MKRRVGGVAFALPWFGSLEEGLAERDERAGRKEGCWMKRPGKTLARKKNESSASPKKLKEGEGDMNALTKRRQREGLAREWKM